MFSRYLFILIQFENCCEKLINADAKSRFVFKTVTLTICSDVYNISLISVATNLNYYRTMAANGSFPDHVQMYNYMAARPSTLVDVAIGTFTTGVCIIAIIGNSLAVGYYHGKRDLASKLYFHISCIDIANCVLHFPMIYPLLNQRHPGLFISKTFCGLHAAILSISMKSYPIAVLLLVVSRTIAIMRPFYRIKKHLVVSVLYIIAIFFGIEQLVRYLVGFTTVYGADGPYCYSFYDTSKTENPKNIKSIVQTARFLLWLLSVGAPAFANVVSLILILKKLLTKPVTSLQGEQRSDHQVRQRKAATTVFIFTAVFMLFFTPVLSFFIYRSVAILTGSHKYIFSQYFMLWYSWTVLEVLNLVNAMCDFLVYFTRIKDFRDWLMQKRQVVTEYYNSTMRRRGTQTISIN